MQGGSLLISQIRSRDYTAEGPSAVSDRSGARGYSDSSALGTSLSTIGRYTDLPAVASSFAFPGQFQSWATQRPPAFEDWNSIYDYRFLPIQVENPARSVQVFWEQYVPSMFDQY